MGPGGAQNRGAAPKQSQARSRLAPVAPRAYTIGVWLAGQPVPRSFSVKFGFNVYSPVG